MKRSLLTAYYFCKAKALALLNFPQTLLPWLLALAVFALALYWL